MHLLQFSSLRIHQKLRLVPDPVDVYPLPRNPFHGHTERLGTMVGIQILVVVVAKLGVLVARGVFLLVLEPHEVEVSLAAITHDSFVDGFIIRHDILGLSADIVRRIKGRFHIGGT